MNSAPEREEGSGSGALARSALLRWLLSRFTPSGRALLGATVVVGVYSAAFRFDANPMYFFASALLSLLVVDALVGWVFRPRAEVERQLPERVAAGSDVRLRARVTNRGRLPLFDWGYVERLDPTAFARAPEPPHARCLLPGASAEAEDRLRPLRRGVYDLPGPLVYSAFPFGFYRTPCKQAAPARLVVTPSFSPLARLDLPAGRRHQPGGLALVSAVGDSEEFLGLREYRAGDRLRDVYARAWARLGRPVVREHRQEYLTRVGLVVDAHAPGRRCGARRAFEAAVSLGAAVADALAREEYVIDLFAAGGELFHFQAGRSLATFEDILDVLACLAPCRSDPFPRLGPRVLDEAGRLSAVVAVFLDWGPSRRDFVRALEERGCALRGVVVCEGAPSSDPGPTLRLLSPAEVEEGVEAL